jgi:hypothetical protein
MSSLTRRLAVLERAVADAADIADFEAASIRYNDLRIELGDLYMDACEAVPPECRDRAAIDFRKKVEQLNRTCYTAIGKILVQTRELNLRRSGRSRSEVGLLTLSRLGLPYKQAASRMMRAARTEDEEEGHG